MIKIRLRLFSVQNGCQIGQIYEKNEDALTVYYHHGMRFIYTFSYWIRVAIKMGKKGH